ncbi:alanine dehydrogenase [Anaeropeptidivorans aminofermentans]|jgi:alanine dehydrogenase|uniref:alanine dehydrogenase n=1 Tax=Anaeropeptidivorans aminofermentans TaxID=2934315 RepID=UPI002023F761|nr:alanine dehydrogenase [Anaeropeptidivorans aminofermentans]
MKIGCVKEIKKHEYRIGMTPDNVKAYVNRNHEVFIEKDGGLGSGFTNEQYAEAGAVILDTAAEVWAKSDMIIKVKEPLAEEYPLMREGQILYTYLHLAASEELTDACLKSGVKGVAYETITDRNGALPLLKPMSEIAGRLSVQEGAKCLEKPMGGSGVLLSGIPGVPRAKVVVVGGGVVGTNAAKIAIGMGADVTIIDLSLDRLTYLDDLFGNAIKTVYSTDAAIEKEVAAADLVIGAVLVPGAAAPKLIKRKYFKNMRPGSVIVDIAVDQGGCCETTHATYHDDPTFVVDGIVHYCVANMPGATPRTATLGLTNATLSRGLLIADKGLEAAAQLDSGIKKGINVYNGELTCKEVAASFGRSHKDIDSLI